MESELRATWVLRVYDTRTDELEREIQLPGFNRSMHPAAAGKGMGSTPLLPAAARELAELHGETIPAGGHWAFFLDYEADERDLRESLLARIDDDLTLKDTSLRRSLEQMRGGRKRSA